MPKHHGLRITATAGALLTMFVLGTHAQVTFTDVTDELGIGNDGRTYSISFNDYSGDGVPDLLIGNGNGSNRLWKQEADGFIETTEASGILNDQIGQHTWIGSSVIQGDYDNDGDLDIYIAVDATPPDPDFEDARNYLYRNNGDGTFTDVTEEAGVEGASTGTFGAVFTDYDGDGFLDIYLVYLGSTNVLYHNNGDGTFSDKVQDAGIEAGLDVQGAGLAAIFFDADNDGDLDLYAVNQFGPLSFFYENQGDGSYRDRSAQSGLEEPGDPTGVAVGDYNNDGFLDLFVANWFQPGTLYENQGDNTFEEVAAKAGVNIEDDCRGCLFFDHDNDGYVDLLIVKKGIPQLFRNQGNGTFEDVSAAVGLTEELGGSVAAVGDYDLDGDLDLYFANTGPGGPNGEPDRFYRNDGGNANHWLQVKVESLQHIDGTGSWVQLRAGDHTATSQVFGGYGNAQDSLTLHFGLGDQQIVDRIEVRFTTGRTVVLEQPIVADQLLTVNEDGFQGFEPASVTPGHKKPMLLADIKRTALLQNFPNPFNPETWFPYVLSEDGIAKVAIYSMNGQLIQTLELGLQKAGSYLDRETAAYWDGRDDFGSHVGSGIYFYQLSVGAFSATRKMVIVK